MKMKKLIHSFFLLVSLSVFLPMRLGGQSATNITVAGRVTDEAGLPVVGAVVSQTDDSTGKKASVTNTEGRFTVQGIQNGASMSVNCLGYAPAVFTASTKAVEIILSEEINQLEQAVVVGYGTIRKRDLTGAVVSLLPKEIENKIATDVFEAMQGQVAGVQIVINSGTPGAGAEVKVRGISTFGDGAAPLYVVDGIPVDDPSTVNPEDIQSIEILKDAASAAIYGSRAANGVILITSKKGTPGRPRLQAKYQFSTNVLANCIDLTTPEQFRYYDRVRKSLGETNLSSDVDPYNRFRNNPYNIMDYLFRPSQKHQLNVSASGGQRNTYYYAGLGFISEDGVVVNSGIKKATMNLSLSYDAAPKVRLTHKLFASYSNRHGLYSESDLLYQLYGWVPYWNIFLADGSYMHNIENRNSPLTIAMESSSTRQVVTTSLQNKAEITLAKNLTLTSTLSASFNSNRNQTYKGTSLLGTTASDKTKGTDSGWYTYSALNENYLNWSYKKGPHSLTALLGTSAHYWQTDYVKITGLDYSTDEHYTINFASDIKVAETTSTISAHSLVSGYTRLTYSLFEKYLFAANLRADASSRFGKNKKWGTFPSVSTGWRFSEEPFMQWAFGILTDGKIRASYGVTGNDAIGNYDARMIYSPGNFYEGVSGIAPSRLGNPELGWETTRQVDLGADLSFFNNRLSFTFDWYNKNTTDLLYQAQLPKETGYSTITRNVGAMNNKGLEYTVTASILRQTNWKWDVTVNFATNNAVVKKLADGVPFFTGSNCIYVRENSRVAEFWGYAHENIFQYDESNAFTPEWKQLTPVFDNGSFTGTYLLNGEPYTGEVKQKSYSDGTVFKGGDVNWKEPASSRNGVIDPDDRQKIGCAQPDWFGGMNTTLTWKSLSLYVSMYWSLGGQIYYLNRKARNSYQLSGTAPEPHVIYNMWTQPGDIAIYPRPVNSVEYNRIGPADFWIEDASYVKLRNVKLTYKFPRALVRKAKLKDVTASGSGNNLLTWTAYTGFDPEFSGASALSFGIDYNRYPRKREFGFGLNVAF